MRSALAIKGWSSVSLRPAAPELELHRIREDLLEQAIKQAVPESLLDKKTRIFVIILIGLAVKNLLFNSIERRTVRRWGMKQ